MTTEAEAVATAEAEPAVKKQKTEQAEPMHEEAAAAPETDAPKAANSVQLGYKTFTDGNEAYQYFSYLLSKLTHNQDINEYEHQSLLALLEKGHVNATEKIGSGVRAFQVRTYAGDKSVHCFYVCRKDGTAVDFSFRKCVLNLFPSTKLPTKQKGGGENKGGRGGGGRGRGGGGRGRGRR